MKKVFQTIVDQGEGNCHQAAVASLLELPLEAVPHFLMYGQEFFNVKLAFMHQQGWSFTGCRDMDLGPLNLEDSINGFFKASVPSKTFKNGFHSVILDDTGLVVHDPNPNGLWLNENVSGNRKVIHEMWERHNEEVCCNYFKIIYKSEEWFKLHLEQQFMFE